MRQPGSSAGHFQSGCNAAASAPAAAQTSKGNAAAPQAQTSDQSDPLKRHLDAGAEEEKFQGTEAGVERHLQEVAERGRRYIITPEEVSAFKQLSNDEERDQFIENFWLRRDPTPDTPENEYKEEHYRRIAYANEHFAAGIPGWKTDRGRIYIIWGPADQIESHPTGGTYDRPQEEGGGTTTTYPWETWRYRYLEGVGQEVNIEFVDPCSCGDYHSTSDPNEKDALLHTPGGATMYEQMGLGNRADRMNPFAANASPQQGLQNSKEFDKLEMLAKVQAPPQGQVQGPGRSSQPQDQRQPDAV